MRFCKRCGFALGGVARLLEADGRLPERSEGDGRGLTARQRGVRKGVLIMAGGLTFGALAVLLAAMKDDLFVFMPVAALVLVVGVMRLLYGLLLEGDLAPARGKGGSPPEGVAAMKGVRAGELPPARGFDDADLTRGRADTAEMAAPPSVTEGTTRMIKDE